MRFILKFEEYSTRLALVLAIVFLIIATVLTFYQVVTRFAFGRPSTWTEVVARSAMVWSTFTGVAAAFRHGSMIAVEIIQRTVPYRFGITLFVTGNLFSAVFFAIVFWQGWGMVLRVQRQTLAALDISIAWAYAALPTGSVFIIIAIIGCTLRGLSGGFAASQSIAEAER